MAARPQVKSPTSRKGREKWGTLSGMVHAKIVKGVPPVSAIQRRTSTTY